MYAHACPQAADAGLMHVDGYAGLRMHVRVLETMKDKFFNIKCEVGMNPTSFGSHSKPSFSTM